MTPAGAGVVCLVSEGKSLAMISSAVGFVKAYRHLSSHARVSIITIFIIPLHPIITQSSSLTSSSDNVIHQEFGYQMLREAVRVGLGLNCRERPWSETRTR
mmetsp:Transcript_15228/g.30847  ORF Transcript_15228/g.30847 Transcript_15228/m.30847 type:complete len:101 (-) Transcript_15228:1003-1305(-)